MTFHMQFSNSSSFNWTATCSV